MQGIALLYLLVNTLDLLLPQIYINRHDQLPQAIQKCISNLIIALVLVFIHCCCNCRFFFCA
jgi:hypothetical protein